ncbi:unnamed protein product [Onchocerca flexuosa]|uniref:PLU-1 domain-containing protein n=1 Tax=Onchocerca flexuosa TaxID=387005 RepID=A0A183H2P0_9BILA|nr:unnamed protein product [Onchocerca flexuosa]
MGTITEKLIKWRKKWQEKSMQEILIFAIENLASKESLRQIKKSIIEISATLTLGQLHGEEI